MGPNAPQNQQAQQTNQAQPQGQATPPVNKDLAVLQNLQGLLNPEMPQSGEGEEQMSSGDVALELALNSEGRNYLQNAYPELTPSEALQAVKAFRKGDLGTYAQLTTQALERRNDKAPAERDKELKGANKVMEPGSGAGAEDKPATNFNDATAGLLSDLRGLRG